MNPQLILGIIGAAIALVPIVYEMVMLTIDAITKMINKKKTQTVIAQIAPAIEEAFKKGEIKNFTPEQLQKLKDIKPGAVTTLELNSNGKIKKGSIKCYDKIDDIVVSQLNKNDGIITVGTNT